MKNNSRCILLIDDDDLTNTLNTLTLQDLKICREVLSFTNSEDALDYINQNSPDICPSVVFVDYYLPSVTAIDVTRQLKEIFPDVKTVVLTAYIGHVQSKEIIESPNVDDLIIKPLTEEKLVESLKKLEVI